MLVRNKKNYTAEEPSNVQEIINENDLLSLGENLEFSPGKFKDYDLEQAKKDSVIIIRAYKTGKIHENGVLRQINSNDLDENGTLRQKMYDLGYISEAQDNSPASEIAGRSNWFAIAAENLMEDTNYRISNSGNVTVISFEEMPPSLNSCNEIKTGILFR